MTQLHRQAPRIMPLIATSRPYISELVLHADASPVGFCIGGAAPGPNVMIAGSTRLTGQVFQRMLLLPSLSRLHGKLFLLQLDRLQGQTDLDLIETRLIRDVIDAQLYLPFLAATGMSAESAENAVRDGYWSALRLCADNGMIAGRGLPQRKNMGDSSVDFIAFSSHATRPVH